MCFAMTLATQPDDIKRLIIIRMMLHQFVSRAAARTRGRHIAIESPRDLGCLICLVFINGGFCTDPLSFVGAGFRAVAVAPTFDGLAADKAIRQRLISPSAFCATLARAVRCAVRPVALIIPKVFPAGGADHLHLRLLAFCSCCKEAAARWIAKALATMLRPECIAAIIARM